MATEPVDWDNLEHLDPGIVPGQWRGQFDGTTANRHERVFLDVESERDPAPEYYEATLTAEYSGDVRLPAEHPFTLKAGLSGRKGATGYIVRGATKEERIGVRHDIGSDNPPEA